MSEGRVTGLTDRPHDIYSPCLARLALLTLWLAGACTAKYDALSVSGDWMIGAYRAVLSPLQGPNVCNFDPTCSQFA